MSQDIYAKLGERLNQNQVKLPLIPQLLTFLRFLNHYPSHVWLFAALGRLDAFLWIYAAINLLYLGRGWLGLVLRFGRAEADA